MRQNNFDKAEIIASIKSAMSSAQNPEDAYRIFMDSAGKGMLQVIADSLQDVVDAAADFELDNSSIEGWQSYIVGPMVQMNFGSMSGIMAFDGGVYPEPAVQETRIAVVPALRYQNPDIQGGSITVSGTWKF